MSTDAYVGMSAITGRALSGAEHLRQSITDVLTTPLGTRIERRDYGSAVSELLDQPGNELTMLRVQSAIVTALLRWEPRFRPARLQVLRQGMDGQLVAVREGSTTHDGQDASMQVMLQGGV